MSDKKSFKVCVFCSASSAIEPSLLQAAREFAEGLVARRWTLVYGGGAAGLMGHFANCAIECGGEVVGIIPTCLSDQREVTHMGLSRVEIVADLFERKRRMMSESDAFVIFPGGLGTLDEALEVLTWKTLGQLDKPIYFVNLNGFWNGTLAVFQDLAARGMIRQEAFDAYRVETDVSGCLRRLDDAVRDGDVRSPA